MASEAGQIDKTDVKFLAKRTAFLVLGAVSTAIVTLWVPAVEDLGAVWTPIIAMALTGLAETLNRVIQDYKANPPEDTILVYRREGDTALR